VQGPNNSLRWNETNGNGFATGPAINFGIGLVGAAATNNLVEENSTSGNTNGIVIFPPAVNNRIRGNVAVGNPPIQQSAGLPAAAAGVDIWDQAGPGANSVDRNVCITAIGASCPAFPVTAIPRKPAN
jgi:nitrous oxidase accessory protein NosD